MASAWDTSASSPCHPIATCAAAARPGRIRIATHRPMGDPSRTVRPTGRPAPVVASGMAVDRSWRSPEGRWIVDQVVDEPGVEYRLWDEGVLAAEVASPEDLHRLLALVNLDPNKLHRINGDPWCE